MKLALMTALREDVEDPKEVFLKRYMANLAPLYLASYLEKCGAPVEIQIKDRLEDFADFNPDVVGISSITENFETAKRLAREAKRRWGSVTLLGGVHITSLPQILPDEFDLGVVGEGEETLVQVMDVLNQGGLPPESALKKISGIVFHTPHGVHQTPYRKGVANLDEIPIPSREKYIESMGAAYMMTSRGCPYTCNFCVIPNISEGYRKHSPEYVLREILSIKKHYPKVRSIRIFDDLYIVDRKRVEKIADLVHAEGLNQELSFGCWGRANLIDEKMIQVFKKMNMLYVAFGAESGSSRVLSKIKPGASVEENQRVIELLSDHGVRVSCSVILGHPEETEEDLWKTYRFLESNMDRLFEVEFNVAIPWPGTDLWNFAHQRGMVSSNMDFKELRECAYFLNYSPENHPYLNQNISPERFEEIMTDFKILFKKMVKKMRDSNVLLEVNPEMRIARYY